MTTPPHRGRPSPRRETRRSSRSALCAALSGDAARRRRSGARRSSWPSDGARPATSSAADQTRGADNVPPFATIAKMQGFSAEAIAQFLMDPHPKMPDMQLSRDEAQDLGAYIASLALRAGRDEDPYA